MEQMLTEVQKGVLYIVGGVILLLHTLNIIQRGLSTIIIFGSLAAIVYGIFKARLHKRIFALIQKKDIPIDKD